MESLAIGMIEQALRDYCFGCQADSIAAFHWLTDEKTGKCSLVWWLQLVNLEGHAPAIRALAHRIAPWWMIEREAALQGEEASPKRAKEEIERTITDCRRFLRAPAPRESVSV